MPLMIEGRVPSRWAERASSRAVVSIDRYRKPADCVNLAFINNMPDAALEDTEMQFFELLDIASGDVPVIVKLYSLTGVPRTDRGQRHLNEFYFGLDELWKSRFDGIIVTGTEPRQPDLRQEPYWGALANVFDWAERQHLFSRFCLVWRRMPACFIATAFSAIACLTSNSASLNQSVRRPRTYAKFRGARCDFRILAGTKCRRTNLRLAAIAC